MYKKKDGEICKTAVYLIMQFLVFYVFAIIHNVQGVHITWDNTVEFEEISDLSRPDEVRMPNWSRIFPGTKWCGAGNISEGEDDFGQFNVTDMCCKNHDNCEDIIEGYQTEHNLTNPSSYTRLNCACDEKFHKCLKDVGSIVSTLVGHLYFTFLNTKCYKNEYPIVSCKKYYRPLCSTQPGPEEKCEEYELDKTQDKMYQWFDLPYY